MAGTAPESSPPRMGGSPPDGRNQIGGSRGRAPLQMGMLAGVAPDRRIWPNKAMMCTTRLFTLIGLVCLSTLPASAHLWRGCADDSPAASAVKTRGDVRAFVVRVECAAQGLVYLEEVGPEEARHAFNEDGPWKHGQIYVFVDGLAKSGLESMTFVYPPDPTREGQVWGAFIDDFGTDLFYEAYRMMQVVDAGWLYYSILNPATGVARLKASYAIEIDWDGHPAVIGAGIYEPDLPSTCRSEEVNASGLEDNPSPESLAAVVRCAAMMLESGGYSALDPRARLQVERWRELCVRDGPDGQPVGDWQPGPGQRERPARMAPRRGTGQVRRTGHGQHGGRLRGSLRLL